LIDAINATIDFRTSAFETDADDALIEYGTKTAASIIGIDTLIWYAPSVDPTTKVYFFVPAENVSVFVGAVAAVIFDPTIATGYEAEPTVEESAAGFPFESFAVTVRVAISPGT
jgi:hypothetical protein